MVKPAHSPLNSDFQHENHYVSKQSWALRQFFYQLDVLYEVSRGLVLTYWTAWCWDYFSTGSNINKLRASCSKHVALATARNYKAKHERLQNIPFIKVVVWVQTQHMPVIQAKSFELPHPHVKQSNGWTAVESNNIKRHHGTSRGATSESQAWTINLFSSGAPALPLPLDGSLSGFNPPRTTTSLLDLSQSSANPESQAYEEPSGTDLDQVLMLGFHLPKIISILAASASF